MSRYFVPITAAELEQKIDDAMANHDGTYATLTPKIEKDLSKVQFDTENEDIDLVSAQWVSSNNAIIGYITIASGMPLLGVWAAGDWETPMLFVIYWDGSDLRGYIPEDGNTWNPISKTALGSGDDDDLKYMQQLFGSAVDEDNYESYMQRVRLDGTKLEADIVARITVKGGAKAAKAVKQATNPMNGLVADCDNAECAFNHKKMEKCLVPSRKAYDHGKCTGFEQRDK